MAGILLLDIVSYSWQRHGFDDHQGDILQVSSAIPFVEADF